MSYSDGLVDILGSDTSPGPWTSEVRDSINATMDSEVSSLRSLAQSAVAQLSSFSNVLLRDWNLAQAQQDAGTVEKLNTTFRSYVLSGVWTLEAWQMRADNVRSDLSGLLKLIDHTSIGGALESVVKAVPKEAAKIAASVSDDVLGQFLPGGLTTAVVLVVALLVLFVIVTALVRV